jgi:hypothetical protein
VWAYNTCGRSTETIITQTTFGIGQNYGGGIIFYIDSTGHHGLISAASDVGYTTWGCSGLLIGATQSGIGTGQNNTTAIVNGCNTAGIAASLCYELVLNGFDDWFLPSKDELNQLYLNKDLIGGFVTYYSYWSSTETDANNAICQFFMNGNQIIGGKTFPLYIRPIRYF